MTTAAAEIKRIEEQKRVVTSQISANETAVAEIEKDVEELESQRRQLRQEQAACREREGQLRGEREN